MITWTGQAQILADDIREPGFTAAAANASAWRARVDPQATNGLIGAALTLTSGEAGSALWAEADPCPDDTTLLAWSAELEGHVAGLLEYARRMAAACRAGFTAALEAARAARELLNGPASPQARADAEDRLAAANRAAADCEAALEILGEAGARLAHALDCLRRVPDDLAGTYEDAYRLVHGGGKLPHHGEFLTGSAA